MLGYFKCPVREGSVVYDESIKREPKIRGINKCRCDERIQTKTKEFTLLPYTGLVLELEHLKIETRLMSERFADAMGESAAPHSVVSNPVMTSFLENFFCTGP